MKSKKRIYRIGLPLILILLCALAYSFMTPKMDYKKLVEKTLVHLEALNTKNTTTLSDGRLLGYAEYGDLGGYPVFYFHGGQESRLSAAFMDSTARSLGIRLITPDRPGIGLSSYHEGRSFKSWANDVSVLADSLDIQSFSVFGLSGGGPHVLACLHEIPERINKASVVSGTGPHNYPGRLKGTWFPVRLVHWFAAAKKDKNLRGFISRERKTLMEKPAKRIRQLQLFLPGPDRKLLKQNPSYAAEFILGSQEAYSNGIEPVVQEWKMYVSDWGFELDKIQKPVKLWYGSKDKMAPKFRGIYLHSQLPNSELQIFENEGHFSLIRNQLTLILIDLIPKSPLPGKTAPVPNP